MNKERQVVYLNMKYIEYSRLIELIKFLFFDDVAFAWACWWDVQLVDVIETILVNYVLALSTHSFFLQIWLYEETYAFAYAFLVMASEGYLK